MTRRKSKPQPRRKPVVGPATRREEGLRAFRQGNYDAAIEMWEQVGKQTPTMRPTAALAEAYFRRGLDRTYGSSVDARAGLDDLRQAVSLLPDDPCYGYHVALAAHRQGDLDGAIRGYEEVRQKGGDWTQRAAYPLAIALLQRGHDPSTFSVWAALSDGERATLCYARAFRHRPYSPPPDAPPIWRGLAAYDRDDQEQARALLEQALSSVAAPLEERIAHYYLGALAARDGNWSEAGRQWGTARARGLRATWLEHNLGELYHRLAEDRLLGGDLQGALAAANETFRHNPGDSRLRDLISHAYQRLAQPAVASGQWATALENWGKANKVGRGTFRLAYNRALAYERTEQWVEAAEAWREALRHRPRLADHPDAISDEQVARLWRRAAESYQRAGYVGQVFEVYRKAIKWEPDNLQLRMTLAESLMNDGRLRAAENELREVVERDPNHIQALLRLGEALAEGRLWHLNDPPTKYWERVLNLDPANANARQLLADFYQDAAENAAYWRDYRRAIREYERALEYQPQNGHVLAALADCYFDLGKARKARSYIEQALSNAGQDLAVYDRVIQVWLDRGDGDQAWKAMERAEATVESISYDFYVHVAANCIRVRQNHLALLWLERAVARAKPDDPVFVTVGEMAVTLGEMDLAQQYLERAVQLNQLPGQAHLMLAIVAMRQDDRKRADAHWREAERIARKTHDRELRQRIDMARMLFTAPPGLAELLLRNRSLLDEGLDLLPGFDPAEFFDDEHEDEF